MKDENRGTYLAIITVTFVVLILSMSCEPSPSTELESLEDEDKSSTLKPEDKFEAEETAEVLEAAAEPSMRTITEAKKHTEEEVDDFEEAVDRLQITLGELLE